MKYLLHRMTLGAMTSTLFLFSLVNPATAETYAMVETYTTPAPGATMSTHVMHSSSIDKTSYPGTVSHVVQNALIIPRTDPLIIRTEIVTPPVARSNYGKRLADLLDQINLGAEKGWLTAREADDLRNWQSDVIKEESILRMQDGGIVGRDDANVLERHVNGLAYITAKKLNAYTQHNP